MKKHEVWLEKLRNLIFGDLQEPCLYFLSETECTKNSVGINKQEAVVLLSRWTAAASRPLYKDHQRRHWRPKVHHQRQTVCQVRRRPQRPGCSDWHRGRHESRVCSSVLLSGKVTANWQFFVLHTYVNANYLPYCSLLIKSKALQCFDIGGYVTGKASCL